MDINQLEVVVAVAQEKSFSRAAETLHRTQPAVSQAIRRLEAELGEPLFDRSSKDGTLTAAGLVLFEFAQQMLNLRRHAHTALRELKNLHRGKLTLSANEYTVMYLLPLIPAMALMAACYGPFAAGRSGTWMLVFICAGIMLKLAAPENPWGLSYRAGTIQPLAPALSRYCEQQGPDGLIVVDLVDDLYAAALPCSTGSSSSTGEAGFSCSPIRTSRSCTSTQRARPRRPHASSKPSCPATSIRGRLQSRHR